MALELISRLKWAGLIDMRHLGVDELDAAAELARSWRNPHRFQPKPWLERDLCPIFTFCGSQALWCPETRRARALSIDFYFARGGVLFVRSEYRTVRSANLFLAHFLSEEVERLSTDNGQDRLIRLLSPRCDIAFCANAQRDTRGIFSFIEGARPKRRSFASAECLYPWRVVEAY